MLNKFIEILDYSFETFEDSLILNSAKIIDRDLILDITLHYEDENDSSFEKFGIWEMKITGVRYHNIVLGNCLSFDYVDEDADHILKWKQTKPYYSVSFRGNAENPSEVIGKLYEVHSRIVKEWISFNEFFNMNFELDKLISGGFGLLADYVPEPLAFAYKNVLEDYGVSATLSEPRLLSYWNGEKRTTETVPVRVLILGESDIVAEKIEAKEISSRII